MKKSDLKVGNSIFLVPMGNAARYNNIMIETKITKVARKYFYVEDFSRSFSETKFEIESGNDFCGQYSSNWKAYLTKECIEKKKRKHKLNDSIRNIFKGYGDSKLSLEQLEKIYLIIKETK